MKIALAVGACVLLLVVAACGGGATSSQGNRSLTIMMIASLQSPQYSAPWLKTAAQISVDEVNANGGVDGRKIDIEFCNDKFDPNEAVSCAQRAVSEGVLSVVGGVTCRRRLGCALR